MPRGNGSNQYPLPAAPNNELSSPQSGFNKPQDVAFGFDTFMSQLGLVCPAEHFPIETSSGHPSEESDVLAYPHDNRSSFPPSLLETRAFQLQNGLRAAAAELNVDPQAVAVATEQTLTAYNIEIFSRLYFAHWHKHGTMLAATTFDTACVQDSLLLAVMCIGGNYTPNRYQLYQLKYLLDVIEHYIFKKVEHMGDEVWPADFDLFDVDEGGWQGKIEDFQAAYLICVAQYWTGSRMAKRRARRERFAKLVTVSAWSFVL